MSLIADLGLDLERGYIARDEDSVTMAVEEAFLLILDLELYKFSAGQIRLEA